jgi:hypothetical protein
MSRRGFYTMRQQGLGSRRRQPTTGMNGPGLRKIEPRERGDRRCACACCAAPSVTALAFSALGARPVPAALPPRSRLIGAARCASSLRLLHTRRSPGASATRSWLMSDTALSGCLLRFRLFRISSVGMPDVIHVENLTFKETLCICVSSHLTGIYPGLVACPLGGSPEFRWTYASDAVPEMSARAKHLHFVFLDSVSDHFTFLLSALAQCASAFSSPRSALRKGRSPGQAPSAGRSWECLDSGVSCVHKVRD